jgi:hypothetical protein
MFISSYFGSKYAQKRPLCIPASIAFEKLYEMIEETAQTALNVSILSCISGMPL